MAADAERQRQAAVAQTVWTDAEYLRAEALLWWEYDQEANDHEPPQPNYQW